MSIEQAKPKRPKRLISLYLSKENIEKVESMEQQGYSKSGAIDAILLSYFTEDTKENNPCQ